MNRFHHSFSFLVLPLLLAAFVASCRQKDIDCPTGVAIVHMQFEWENAPRADVAGMTLYFYPLSEHGRIWRFDIAGADGGPVELPLGSYSMVAFNNDLPALSVDGASNPATLRAVPRFLPPGDTTYTDIGMLYCATVRYIDITPCDASYYTPDGGISSCPRRVVRCFTDSVSARYSVRIDSVVGLQHVRSVIGVIHGVSTSMLLLSQQPSPTSASLVFNMTADLQNSVIAGSACAFAPPVHSGARYTLSLQIVRTDGVTLRRDIEILPSHLNTLSPHNVLITLSGLEIPVGDISSGDIEGIGAIVDGWQVVEIYL